MLLPDGRKSFKIGLIV